MYDADRPILKSSEDRLNRAQFAKYLARCMLDHQDPDSMVIGLNGAWGSGKTSLINMVIEELNFAGSNMLEDEMPIIMNFSAWSYSGQNQLIYSFFRRLSSTLRRAPNIEKRDEIIHLLELYVSFFTHKAIPQSLRAKQPWWKKILFSEHDFYGWESGQDLTLVKAKLNEALKQQKHRIIIFIDNISQLYDYEIKQIFQIVKSMGDYANTIYLLSFDKKHAVHALNKLEGHGGEQMIEKMIQMPFDIPPILQHDLENILASRLDKMIESVPADTWNSQYWADMYYNSLKYFFQNCRDITRYINTLNFSYSRLKEVVNPVDFFSLTAIEVFLPTIYAGIRDNKDLFTDLLDNVYVFDNDLIQKDKTRCEEILARSNRIPKTALLDLLMRLFPRIRHLYEPNSVFYHSDSIARKLRRICSPDLFDVYFRLSLHPSQIPSSEFDTILALSSDQTIFDQALTRLNQDDRIIKFLDQLDSHRLNKIPEENIQAILNALLDNGDLFPQGLAGHLSLDTPMRIHRIIESLLHRIKNSEDRFILLQNAIAHSNKSIYISVMELNEIAKEHREESDTLLPLEFRLLTPDELTSLKKLTSNQIENWSADARLEEHPKLLPLLYAWRDWGEEGRCQQYVKHLTSTDKGLVIFLVAALEKAIDEAMTEHEKKPSWDQCLLNITAFIPIDDIKPRAKALFEDNYFEKLRENEQLALMIFLDLTKSATKKVIPNTTA